MKEKWRSILGKFLVHFYGDYEESTPEDYVGAPFIESIQTKDKKGGYCSTTGRPLQYGQSVSFADALSAFKKSLTDEEYVSIHISQESEEYPDVEEHDEEREWTKIKVSLISSQEPSKTHMG